MYTSPDRMADAEEAESDMHGQLAAATLWGLGGGGRRGGKRKRGAGVRHSKRL